MLLEEFFTPMSLPQRELANAIDVPYRLINNLVNGRRGATPSSALRLARFWVTRLSSGWVYNCAGFTTLRNKLKIR